MLHSESDSDESSSSSSSSSSSVKHKAKRHKTKPIPGIGSNEGHAHPYAPNVYIPGVQTTPTCQAAHHGPHDMKMQHEGGIWLAMCLACMQYVKIGHGH